MSAKILQGEAIAKRILEDLKRKVKPKLKLAVIQVGNNPVSEKYIQKKQEAAKSIGVDLRLYKFPQNVSQEELKIQVQAIGSDKEVSGMIVQLPLPKHLDTQEILDAIPLEKDVDVLSSASFGLFALGKSSVLPPTVGAVSLLLKEHHMDIKGKNIVIVGAGRLVGLPLTIWCIHQGATVTVANEYTKDLPSLTKKAEILISGVGRAGLIKGDMVQTGAVVIDAGTSVEGEHTLGDVDFESVAKKAGFLTPVPGGVGPLTVVYLLRNLIELAQSNQ